MMWSAAFWRSRSSAAVCATAASDHSIPPAPTIIAAVKLPLPTSFRKFRRSAEATSLSILSIKLPPFETYLSIVFASGPFPCFALQDANDKGYGCQQKHDHLGDVAHEGTIADGPDRNVRNEGCKQEQCRDECHLPPPIAQIPCDSCTM